MIGCIVWPKLLFLLFISFVFGFVLVVFLVCIFAVVFVVVVFVFKLVFCFIFCLLYVDSMTFSPDTLRIHVFRLSKYSTVSRHNILS